MYIIKYLKKTKRENLNLYVPVSITTKLWSYFIGFSSRRAGISQEVNLGNTPQIITECVSSANVEDIQKQHQHDSDRENIDNEDGI